MRQRWIVSRLHDDSGRAVLLGATLFASFMERVKALHARGRNAGGFFLSPIRADGRDEPRPVEAWFAKDENDFEPSALAAFEDNVRRARRTPVAPFHTQPAAPTRFAKSDYVPHSPPFAWHLVVSLSEAKPFVQPFMLEWKDGELIADPVLLLVEGHEHELAAVERVMADVPPHEPRRHAPAAIA